MLLVSAFVSMAGMSYAQTDYNTLQFEDKDGNVVENGSVITVNEYEKDEFDEDAPGFISTGLSVTNTTPDKVGVGVTVDLQKMDNGYAEFCFPVNCKQMLAVGSYEQKGQLDAYITKELATEWFPEAYGKSTMKIKLQVLKASSGFPPTYTFVANGPEVTVNFVYADPTGIEQIENKASRRVVGYYDVKGVEHKALQKGINIVKYAGGKVSKVFIK